MEFYLIKLFSHAPNDGRMFHAVLHLSRYFSLASRSTNEKLHNGSQTRVPIGLVLFNPLVNYLLQ